MTAQLTVTPEDIASFEEVYGFKGIGERMINAGLWKLGEPCKKTAMVPPSSTVSKTKARGAPVLSSHS
jgi:hypothetical protein